MTPGDCRNSTLPETGEVGNRQFVGGQRDALSSDITKHLRAMACNLTSTNRFDQMGKLRYSLMEPLLNPAKEQTPEDQVGSHRRKAKSAEDPLQYCTQRGQGPVCSARK